MDVGYQDTTVNERVQIEPGHTCQSTGARLDASQDPGSTSEDPRPVLC